MIFQQKDKELMYLIGRNSRYSLTALAKAIKTSKEVVRQRLNRFKQIRFMLGTTANINYELIGMFQITILLKLRGTSQSRLDAIENFITSHSSFIDVKKTFGGWDYVIDARAYSIHDINDLLDELISNYREIIKLENMTVLDEHGPGWKMLVSDDFIKKGTPMDNIAYTKHFQERTERTLIGIDGIDRELLAALSENARTNILKLSEDTGFNYRTIIKRIKRLIGSGVIQSFDTMANVQVLGYSRREIYLQLANISKNYRKADSFFSSIKECSRFWRYAGAVNYKLNVNIKSTRELENILRRIRNRFKDDLLSIESLDVLEEIKRQGFPKELRPHSAV